MVFSLAQPAFPTTSVAGGSCSPSELLCGAAQPKVSLGLSAADTALGPMSSPSTTGRDLTV